MSQRHGIFSLREPGVFLKDLILSQDTQKFQKKSSPEEFQSSQENENTTLSPSPSLLEIKGMEKGMNGLLAVCFSLDLCRFGKLTRRY